MNRIAILLGVFSLFIGNQLLAEICGKVDVGPAYIHVDVLESGKTVGRMDMGGVKSDATVVVWKGLCLKPYILYGYQNKSRHLFSGGGGIGHYTPITDTISITPSIGCLYTEVKTNLTVHPENSPFPLDVRERFRSVTPYLGMDITWCFCPTWRICAQYQYCWSRTHTKLTSDFFTKNSSSHSWGPSYSLLLEKDLNNKWSVNVGAAYNISLSKEKHGIRGYGVKLAIAYWF